MARNISAIVSGAGWLASFADALFKALRERDISDEEVHRLAADTKEGKALIGKIADLFAGARRTLADMIFAGKFDSVNSNITEEHFPSERIRGKVKIFHFDRFISSENAVKEMEKEGYVPANIYELLQYAEKDWNGKDVVVALGSVWRDRIHDRDVAYLWGDSGGRDLSLYWFGIDWNAHSRFAAVRK